MATPSRAAPAPHTLPPRKPMASARRVSLFEREIRIGLSSAALDILFQLAQVLSEGAHQDGGYFGSTMITIDLGRATSLVSEPCDGNTAHRLAELLARDPRVREVARHIAVGEAARTAGAPVGPTQVDLRVRVSGRLVHIDVDVEARQAGQEHSRARAEGAGREVMA